MRKPHIRHPQGAVRVAPEAPPAKGKHRSQAHGGVHPLNQFSHRTQQFEPLPRPAGVPPYHYDIAGAYNDPAFGDLGGLSAKSHSVVFHVVGDTGGVKNGDPQMAVADAMIEDFVGNGNSRDSSFITLETSFTSTGSMNNTTNSSMSRMESIRARSFPFLEIMTVIRRTT